MTHRATIATKHVFGINEFWEERARAWFGDEAVDSLPRFVRGKRVGQIKGVIEYRKVERGGWVSQGNYHGSAVGYVENRVGRVISATLKTMEWRMEGEIVAEYTLKKTD